MGGLLLTDAVWKHMVRSHFQQALEMVGRLSTPVEEPETVLAALPEGASRSLYLAMLGTSAECFVLQPRARLTLEIYELVEWDKHHRHIIVLREATALADVLGRRKLAESLREGTAPHVLELVSLQALGNGKFPKFPLEEVRWAESADADLVELMSKRLQQRRTWWHRQREFLIEDMTWR